MKCHRCAEPLGRMYFIDNQGRNYHSNCAKKTKDYVLSEFKIKGIDLFGAKKKLDAERKIDIL